jgi:hypothetical protein
MLKQDLHEASVENHGALIRALGKLNH